VVILEWSL